MKNSECDNCARMMGLLGGNSMKITLRDKTIERLLSNKFRTDVKVLASIDRIKNLKADLPKDVIEILESMEAFINSTCEGN